MCFPAALYPGLRLPDHLHVLCIRTLVIGAGNSFGVLIPLSEISDEGHTYRIIWSDDHNREYASRGFGRVSFFPGMIRRNDLIPGVHDKKAAKMVDKPVSIVHVFV